MLAAAWSQRMCLLIPGRLSGCWAINPDTSEAKLGFQLPTLTRRHEMEFSVRQQRRPYSGLTHPLRQTTSHLRRTISQPWTGIARISYSGWPSQRSTKLKLTASVLCDRSAPVFEVAEALWCSTQSLMIGVLR